MARSENLHTLLNEVATVTENVAIRQLPHFYRDEVVVALLRRPVIRGLLLNVNPITKEIVVEWLESAVGSSLQQRDRYRVRLYENYPTRGAADDGYGGARRWIRTGPQFAEMFMRLKDEPQQDARELRAKSDVYVFIANALSQRSEQAHRKLCWDDIKDEIGASVMAFRQKRIAG